ncbi:conserved hypothetical protein [Neospora caninum Liverpool]|uniref:Uncharacterized protein n=1 Tax=Neospora caninum (strain Liverpool) TaxID=572307 RepID=F0VLP2_NEOCL|nr:conserved hypothetical protein [Neospora caninum Liverpool]CBZ54170.1 conserved hypothetical protein [Neospora caninum Liverpool]CEL68871.1 TPA: hypothetical protein BN1204_046020 [Neospora caninum Liverpool]|eukprot:XP_003884201.1 conserved hypothetical protein [Neospora caninum Liverpool]
MAWVPGPRLGGGAAAGYRDAGPEKPSNPLKSSLVRSPGQRETLTLPGSRGGDAVSLMRSLSPTGASPHGLEPQLASGPQPGPFPGGQLGSLGVRVPRMPSAAGRGVWQGSTASPSASQPVEPSQFSPTRFRPSSSRRFPSVATASLDQLKALRLDLLEEQKSHQLKMAEINREALELQETLRSQQATVLELQQKLISQQRAFQDELVALRLSAPLAFVSLSPEGTCEPRELKALSGYGVETPSGPNSGGGVARPHPSAGGDSLLARKRQLQAAEESLSVTQAKLEATRQMLHSVIEDEEGSRAGSSNRSVSDLVQALPVTVSVSKAPSSAEAAVQPGQGRVEGGGRVAPGSSFRGEQAARPERGGEQPGTPEWASPPTPVVPKLLPAKTSGSPPSSQSINESSAPSHGGPTGVGIASGSRDPAPGLTPGGLSPTNVSRLPVLQDTSRKSTLYPMTQAKRSTLTLTVSSAAVSPPQASGLSKVSDTAGVNTSSVTRQSLEIPTFSPSAPKVNNSTIVKTSTPSYVSRLSNAVDSGATKTSAVPPAAQLLGKANMPRNLRPSEAAGLAVHKPTLQPTHKQIRPALSPPGFLGLESSAGASQAPTGKWFNEQNRRPNNSIATGVLKPSVGATPTRVATQKLTTGEKTLLLPSGPRIIAPS